jgi:hypothetical protein
MNHHMIKLKKFRRNPAEVEGEATSERAAP